jgi:hypothetical protein
MQERLVSLMEIFEIMVSGASLSVSTFINVDGTVDGELRCGNLPEDWRDSDQLTIISDLSEMFRAFHPFPEEPPMGGKFWLSIGVRFGPQNEMEVGELADLYKRFRGMFQIGTYPIAAWNSGAIQVAIAVSLRTMLQGLAEKQGLPPSALLIRFIWIPDGSRPGHFDRESGKMMVEPKKKPVKKVKMKKGK